MNIRGKLRCGALHVWAWLNDRPEDHHAFGLHESHEGSIITGKYTGFREGTLEDTLGGEKFYPNCLIETEECIYCGKRRKIWMNKDGDGKKGGAAL